MPLQAVDDLVCPRSLLYSLFGCSLYHSYHACNVRSIRSGACTRDLLPRRIVKRQQSPTTSEDLSPSHPFAEPLNLSTWPVDCGLHTRILASPSSSVARSNPRNFSAFILLSLCISNPRNQSQKRKNKTFRSCEAKPNALDLASVRTPIQPQENLKDFWNGWKPGQLPCVFHR